MSLYVRYQSPHTLVIEEAPAHHALYYRTTRYWLPFPWIYYCITLSTPSTGDEYSPAYMGKLAHAGVRMGWGLSALPAKPPTPQKCQTYHIAGQPMTNAFGIVPCFTYGRTQGCKRTPTKRYPRFYTLEQVFADIYQSWWSESHQSDGWGHVSAHQLTMFNAIMGTTYTKQTAYLASRIYPPDYYRAWETLSAPQFSSLCKKHLQKSFPLASLIHERLDHGDWSRQAFEAPAPPTPPVTKKKVAL